MWQNYQLYLYIDLHFSYVILIIHAMNLETCQLIVQTIYIEVMVDIAFYATFNASLVKNNPFAISIISVLTRIVFS